MYIIADFLSAWKLKLSVSKTTPTTLHLNNKETKRRCLGQNSALQPQPNLNGIKIDCQVTYKQQV